MVSLDIESKVEEHRKIYFEKMESLKTILNRRIFEQTLSLKKTTN
jgi:hypothetical protein